MLSFLKKRPWILVCIAFAILFTAWGILFSIALDNQPEKIPLEHLESNESADNAGEEES